MCNAGAVAGMQVAQGALAAQNAMAEGKQTANYYNYLANRNQEQMKLVDESTEENIHGIRLQASKDIDKNKREYDQLISTQKASMAANGVYANSGSAQDIVDDSIYKQKLDEMAIRYNSSSAVIQEAKNAINTKNQLSAEMTTNRIQASNAKAAAKINAMSSLVSSATQAAGTYLSAKNYAPGGSNPSSNGSTSSGSMNSVSRSSKMSKGW